MSCKTNYLSFEKKNGNPIMREMTEDAMLSYSQFNDYVSELRDMSNIAVTDADLIEAAKNGGLIARQRLEMEDGTVFNVGDSVFISAEHAFCNPEMMTTKQHQANAAKYEAAKNHLAMINPLVKNAQQARRAVGDTESLVNILPIQIAPVETSLNELRQWQEKADAELITALNHFYKA
jgi:hypothetical protein